MTIRLLIVDDHPFVREALRMTFEETEIEPVAEAENGQAAFEALQQHADVDVALVDIRMPQVDGLQFLRLVREAGLTTPVVMHSAWSNAHYVEACRALGARGFVEKGSEPDVLLSAIRSAAAGSTGNPNHPLGN